MKRTAFVGRHEFKILGEDLPDESATFRVQFVHYQREMAIVALFRAAYPPDYLPISIFL